MAAMEDFIDQLITDVVELPLTDPNVADDWRPWILSQAQRQLSSLYKMADWPWAIGRITAVPVVNGLNYVNISAAITSQGALPFSRAGRSARVYAYRSGDSVKRILKPLDAPMPNDLALVTGNSLFESEGFSVVQRNGIVYLYFTALAQTGELFNFEYTGGAPTLSDADPGGLDVVPEDVVNDLLFPFMEYRIYRKMKEVDEANASKQEFKDNLAVAVSNVQAEVLQDPDAGYGDNGIPDMEGW